MNNLLVANITIDSASFETFLYCKGCEVVSLTQTSIHNSNFSTLLSLTIGEFKDFFSKINSVEINLLQIENCILSDRGILFRLIGESGFSNVTYNKVKGGLTLIDSTGNVTIYDSQFSNIESISFSYFKADNSNMKMFRCEFTDIIFNGSTIILQAQAGVFIDTVKFTNFSGESIIFYDPPENYQNVEIVYSNFYNCSIGYLIRSGDSVGGVISINHSSFDEINPYFGIIPISYDTALIYAVYNGENSLINIQNSNFTNIHDCTLKKQSILIIKS